MAIGAATARRQPAVDSAMCARQALVVALVGLLSGLVQRIAAPQEFVRIGNTVTPPFSECEGYWLSFTSPLVVDTAGDWGPHNHFDGEHRYGADGVDDFSSCMHQCIAREGCHMFHYVRQSTEHKCGVPSTGLPGEMASAPAYIPRDNVGVYTLGTCDCPGCCTGIAAPVNGHIGNCREDGTLTLGESCDLSCSPGFNMAQGTTRLTCDQAGASLIPAGAVQMECIPCPERHFSTDGTPCQPCSEPEEGQFVEYACLPHADSVIQNCTDLCGPSYGETSHCVAGDALNPGTPRVCERCISGSTWSSGGEGDTCADCAICGPGEEETTRCYGWQNSECHSCADGRYNGIDRAQDGLPCLECPSCDPGSGEVTPCDGTHPPTCEACDPDLDVWSGGGIGATCRPCRSCVPGEEQLGNCSLTSDTFCSECQPGMYSTVGGATEPCVDCHLPCLPGQEEIVACTNATNRVCIDCPAGKYSLGSSISTVSMDSTESVVTNVTSQITTTSSITTVETIAKCMEWTPCDPLLEYEAEPPTNTTDRWCVPFECDPECDPRARCTALNTDGSNHIAECICGEGFWGTGVTCMPVSPCTEGFTYELVASTPTTDRVCVDATICSAGEYETAAVSLTADRSCGPCAPGTYQPRTGQVSCAQCELGTYDDDRDATTPCVICPLGFVVSADSLFCQAAIVLAVTVDANIESMPAGSAPRQQFNDEFAATVADVLEINVTRINLLGVEAGSVIVHLEILPSTDDIADSPSALAETFIQLFSSPGALGAFSVLSSDFVDDPCVVHPCDMDATCSRLAFGSYLCECNTGFFGTGHSCLVTSSCLENFTYEVQAPTPTSDRICATVTSCDSDEFESRRPDALTDRLCTLCDDGAMVVQTPAGTACEPCDNTTYDHDETSATRCVACPSGRFGVNGTICQVDDPCQAGVHGCAPQAYCTRTGPGRHVCTCEPGFFGGGDWCSPWKECTLGSSYAVNQPSSSEDRICVAVTDCLADEYETQRPQLTHDRVCSVCPAGHVVSVEGDTCGMCNGTTYDNDLDSSTRCVECPSGSEVNELRTSCVLINPCISDHDCHSMASCTHTGTGTHSCRCNADFFGDGRWCSPWTNCILGLTYEYQPPTSTSDRVCVALRQCTTTEYETHPPQLTVDRRCARCDPGAAVSENGTACELCGAGMYDSDQNSGTPCTVCPRGFRVEENRTSCVLRDPCADAALNDCHPEAACTTDFDGSFDCECIEGFFGSGAWCAPWTECVVGSTYETRRPTSRSDRQCASVSVCAAGERQTREPQCVKPAANMTSESSGSWVSSDPESASGSWSIEDPHSLTPEPGLPQLACGFPAVVVNRQCQVCSPGSYQPYVGQVSCPVCDSGTYDDDQDPVTPCVDCPTGSVVNSERTTCTLRDPCARTWDNMCHTQAECRTTRPGEYECECLHGFMGDGEWCTPWTHCVERSSFETREPNSTHDRQCTAVTECRAGEYEASAPAYSKDRRCESCPVGSYSAPGELSCHPCTTMHKDHDKDPSTPCQANLGLLVGAIMFLTIAGLVSAVTVPLYCRPRNRVSPDSKYLEGELVEAPKESQGEAQASPSGSGGEYSSSEDSDEIEESDERDR